MDKINKDELITKGQAIEMLRLAFKEGFANKLPRKYISLLETAVRKYAAMLELMPDANPMKSEGQEPAHKNPKGGNKKC